MKYFLFFAAFCSGFLACQSETPQSGAQSAPTPGATPSLPTAERRTIIFYGTSLTAAYQLSPEQGFSALIQQKIDSLGLPYRCVNAGVSGETTAAGASRIDWVLRQPVDVFVLELGANDALRGLPTEQLEQNLQDVIDRVKARNPDCAIVIAGMLAPPNVGRRYADAFAAVYPAVAKRNRAVLIPFLLEGVAAEPALNLEDGIHPNVEGQKIVAENVWRVLRPVLEKQGK